VAVTTLKVEPGWYRHVEVRDHVVALAVGALEPRENRLELVLLARQVVVAVELEPAPAVLDERVADRMGEGATGGIGTGVGAILPAPLTAADGEPGAVVRREDEAARDLLLLDQRPPVGRIVLESAAGLERAEPRELGRGRGAPARGVHEEHREQEDEEPEELDDLPVHTSPPRRPASERA
jgi:hypothetical protein